MSSRNHYSSRAYNSDLEYGAPTHPRRASLPSSERPSRDYSGLNLFFRRPIPKNQSYSNLTASQHAKLKEKGQPPRPHRLNPIKATKITAKSTSRLSAWSNFLFPAVPIGIALWYAKREWSLAIFIVNYIAMVPSANLLAFASGEIALSMPKTVGAVIEVVAGAIVEIIVCLILLFQGQIEVVKAALLGNMLANLLLVTGSCFVVGGITWKEQELAEFVTEVSGAALLVSAAGVLLPSQFYQAIYSRAEVGAEVGFEKVLHVSRIVSIGLLVAYFCFIFFQLKTHSTAFHHVIAKSQEDDADLAKEQYRKKLSLFEAVILTLVGITLVSFCAYFLVSEIPYIVEHHHISDPFMGLILVPLIEKAAEHLMALDDAWDRQMDLALSHSLSATVQTALLVAPLTVIVGWAAHKEMELNFEYFMAFSLLLAVLVVGNFVRDRKTNWLEGAFLIMVYFIIAVIAFYYPNPAHHGGGGGGH